MKNDNLLYISSLAPRGVRTASEYLDKAEWKRTWRKIKWALWGSVALASLGGVVLGLFVSMLVIKPVAYTEPYRIEFDGPVTAESLERCRTDANCLDISTTFVEP